MAFVNYSVPDDIKEAFNIAFVGKNKSAVIAQLMRDAVERELRRRIHVVATEAILRRGAPAPAFIDTASNDLVKVCK
jgi:hypothetical protein